LASSGITCNAVAPGAVHGGLCKELGAERIVAQIPLGRLAQPLEIACAVCFLLSAEAGYITGEILDVDGGWTMD
jgi:3-oxoacyl-[acyl-carrier protein] reductase